MIAQIGASGSWIAIAALAVSAATLGWGVLRGRKQDNDSYLTKLENRVRELEAHLENRTRQLGDCQEENTNLMRRLFRGEQR